MKVNNYKDGKFYYPYKNENKSEGSFFKILKQQLNKSKKTRPNMNIKVVKTNIELLNEGGDNVTWFGHSTVLLKIDGKFILTDPLLGMHSSPFKFGGKRFSDELPIEIDELPQITAVVISHNHYDHLDATTIKKLKDKVECFIVPIGIGGYLKKWGVKNIIELNWFEETIYKDIKFIGAPSRHYSRRGLTGGNTTLWSSWIIKGQNANTFFSGDSGYGEHFKIIGEEYGPFDLTLMENGQYNKTGWWESHMLPEETVQAHMDVKGKVLLPIHWGAFTLSIHEWDEPVTRAIKHAELNNVNIIVPQIGETIPINEDIELKKWWEEVK